VLIGWVQAPSAFALQLIGPITQLHVESEAGDPLNRGGAPGSIRHWDVSESEGHWSIFANTNAEGKVDQIRLEIIMFQSQNGLGANYPWLLSFSSRQLGVPLSPGFYSDAMRYGNEFPGHPGMNIAGGCSRISGDFSILDIEFRQGTMVRFAARFTQHCDGLTFARSGIVYYHSAGAAPPVPPLVINTTSLPDSLIGAPYSQTLEAVGGIQPYSWRLKAGQLPPGLTLSTSGLLTGIPTVIDNFNFTLQVSDTSEAGGIPTQMVERMYSISVRDSPLLITTPSPPRAMTRARFEYQLAATGGSPPYRWSLIDGQLPQGLSLSSQGLVSGAPTLAGTFHFTVEVADSASRTARAVYELKVLEPPLITFVKYKSGKRKLTIEGENFSAMATLWIDGHQVTPKTQDDISFIVKKLSLETGTHDIRVVNPDGGTVSMALIVP
jgi:putative Ig domain-containing protein